MKQKVKEAVGHYRVMIDHTLQPYEPSREHILKRMVRPLCSDIQELIEKGTKNDAWEFLEGVSRECRKVFGC